MPDFSRRETTPEWMDTQAVSDVDFAQCLSDLEQVGWLTRSWPLTRAFLERATSDWPPGAEIRIADIGYGKGGLLRRVHGWATARGLRPVLTGVDLNPQCRTLAEAATPAGMAIAWHEGDLFDWAPDSPPHFVLSALFAHHLDDAGVVDFLRWQERSASHGWFVNDLHRHWFAWGGFWLLSRAVRWHRFVRHDGPLSVRRAFVRRDWERLLGEAGVTADIAWRIPFRLCVGRIKAAPAPAA
jgi:hypothetical protein